jgi:hypothetical protein
VGQPEPRQPSGQDPRQTPTGDSVGAGMEVGPADHLLQVFITDPGARPVGPIWTRDLIDGLDGPTVPLLQQLKTAWRWLIRRNCLPSTLKLEFRVWTINPGRPELRI